MHVAAIRLTLQLHMKTAVRPEIRFAPRGKAVRTPSLTNQTSCGVCTFGRNAHNWYPVLILCVSVMHFDRQVAVPQLMNHIAEDIASTALVCCL